ncbi:hypothetical protein [Streptomyces parvus]|uniref:hypothetical protein n=1 Tax=Streptomyces parvus TaxID=66428 RepID=UPI001653D884|nr:hypothetical protein [Streptomyces parvus]
MSTHPDLPETLVHFTGRPRGRSALREFPQRTPEQRLVSILHSGNLCGAHTFGTDAPVICFSEATEEARRVMLRDGAGARGPYEPWGLVLARQQLIAVGARPVLHVSREERTEMQASLPQRTYNRCVVYEPDSTRGRSDWLHEREWRLCFENGNEPVLPITSQLVVEAGTVSPSPRLVVGVIVGTSGWIPPPRYRSFEEAQSQLDLLVHQVQSAMRANTDHQWPSIPVHAYGVEFARPANGLARWFWNGSELVWDGFIDIQAQEWETALRWGGTLPGLSAIVDPPTAPW